jgi:hypothetical protein
VFDIFTQRYRLVVSFVTVCAMKDIPYLRRKRFSVLLHLFSAAGEIRSKMATNTAFRVPWNKQGNAALIFSYNVYSLNIKNTFGKACVLHHGGGHFKFCISIAQCVRLQSLPIRSLQSRGAAAK